MKHSFKVFFVSVIAVVLAVAVALSLRESEEKKELTGDPLTPGLIGLSDGPLTCPSWVAVFDGRDNTQTDPMSSDWEVERATECVYSFYGDFVEHDHALNTHDEPTYKSEGKATLQVGERRLNLKEKVALQERLNSLERRSGVFVCTSDVRPHSLYLIETVEGQWFAALTGGGGCNPWLFTEDPLTVKPGESKVLPKGEFYTAF